MDIRGPGIPGPCIFIECGNLSITFAFVPSKQRRWTGAGLTNYAETLACSQGPEDNRTTVTGTDHR
jgi:hypothetical protein